MLVENFCREVKTSDSISVGLLREKVKKLHLASMCQIAQLNPITVTSPTIHVGSLGLVILSNATVIRQKPSYVRGPNGRPLSQPRAVFWMHNCISVLFSWLSLLSHKDRSEVLCRARINELYHF